MEYVSRADRFDSDFDGNNDLVEYEIGTNPLIPDTNETGIEPLPANTLLQPDEYGEMRVIADDLILSDPLSIRRFSEFAVAYDNDFNCVANCADVELAARQMPDTTGCFLLFWSCDSDEEQVRDLIRQGRDRQDIFTDNGTLRRSYVSRIATWECLAQHEILADCADVVDDAPDDVALVDLGEEVSTILLNLPGGLRPRDLCGNSSTNSGTYRLIDARGNVRYVGSTNNLTRRATEHANDGRYQGQQRPF